MLIFPRDCDVTWQGKIMDRRRRLGVPGIWRRVLGSLHYRLDWKHLNTSPTAGVCEHASFLSPMQSSDPEEWLFFAIF